MLPAHRAQDLTYQVWLSCIFRVGRDRDDRALSALKVVKARLEHFGKWSFLLTKHFSAELKIISHRINFHDFLSVIFECSRILYYIRTLVCLFFANFKNLLWSCIACWEQFDGKIVTLEWPKTTTISQKFLFQFFVAKGRGVELFLQESSLNLAISRTWLKLLECGTACENNGYKKSKQYSHKIRGKNINNSSAWVISIFPIHWRSHLEYASFLRLVVHDLFQHSNQLFHGGE